MLRMLAVVLAAACALGAGAARAELKNQWIEYSHGETRLKGYLTWDDKVTGRRPAVLMIHAREGMTPKNKAEERANARSIESAARTLKELFGI